METTSIVAQLLLALLLKVARSQDCPSGYWYTTQPPANLNCNPVGLSRLTLNCITRSTTDIVNWYWTQNINDAGINGTALDRTNNYDVSMFGTNNKQLHFTVSSSTLGYYWCEISNAVNITLRPSTITPVCLPTGSTTNCTNKQIAQQHNPNTVCVEEGQSDFAYTTPSSSVCGEFPDPKQTNSQNLTLTSSLISQTSVTPSAITSSLVPTISYAPSFNTIHTTTTHSTQTDTSSTPAQDHTTSTTVHTTVSPPSQVPDHPIFTIPTIPLIITAGFILICFIALVMLMMAVACFKKRARSKRKRTNGCVYNPTYGRPELVQHAALSKDYEADIDMAMVLNEAYSTTPATSQEQPIYAEPHIYAEPPIYAECDDYYEPIPTA